MRIAGFDVQYLSHVCFLFTSPKGAVVVTDPFFGKGFEWQGAFNHYLTPPAVPASAIRKCDAIFISHIHGDHCDPEAVKTIVSNTGAKVWAAAEVNELLRAQGAPVANLVDLSEGMTQRLPGMTAQMFAGYDDSFDAQGRANKFALLLEADGRSLFYSGDCHAAPPAMVGRRVDAVFSWPHPDDQKLAAFVGAIPMRQFVLMHGDRFNPGNFWCNFDYQDHAPRIRRLAPGVEVVIPERARTIRSQQTKA